MSIFTHSERTVKKYTVYQAIESAKRAIANSRNPGNVNVTSVAKREPAEKITLEELNRIADRIISDTRNDSYAARR